MPNTCTRATVYDIHVSMAIMDSEVSVADLFSDLFTRDSLIRDVIGVNKPCHLHVEIFVVSSYGCIERVAGTMWNDVRDYIGFLLAFYRVLLFLQ